MECSSKSCGYCEVVSLGAICRLDPLVLLPLDFCRFIVLSLRELARCGGARSRWTCSGDPSGDEARRSRSSSLLFIFFPIRVLEIRLLSFTFQCAGDKPSEHTVIPLCDTILYSAPLSKI